VPTLVITEVAYLVASRLSAAERLGTTEFATLDRRHFTVVRSDLGELTLLP
jgi:hypothetical protein